MAKTRKGQSSEIRTIRDATVLRFVADGYEEASEIAYWYDISQSAVNTSLRRLRRNGLIRHASTGRGEAVLSRSSDEIFPRYGYVPTAAGKRILKEIQEQLTSRKI